MTGAVQRKRLRQASRLAAQGRREEAETQLNALVATTPDFPAAWLKLGHVRLAGDKPREAFEAYSRAATFIETAAEASARIGRLAKPGPADHLRARGFKIALLVDPTHAAAITDLADLQGGVLLSWFAVAVTSNEIEIDPFRELINRGWTGRAHRLAKIAAVTRPGSSTTQNGLANTAFRREDFEANARFLERAALCSPDNRDIQIAAIEAFFRTGAFERAEAHAMRALSIGDASPASPPLLFWLGRIQRRLGRYADARARFAETLGADEDFRLSVDLVEQGVRPEDFQP